jgi:hypothetical protein
VIDSDKRKHSGMLVIGCEPLGRWGGIPGSLPPETIVRTVERFTHY